MEYSTENKKIEQMIDNMAKDASRENLIDLLESIRVQMNTQGKFLIPVEVPQAAVDMFQSGEIKEGEVLEAKEDLHFVIKKVKSKDGEEMFAAFTSEEQAGKGQSSVIVAVAIENFLQTVLKTENVTGVVLNPWGKSVVLTKELIQMIFHANEIQKPKNHIYFNQGDITEIECDCIVNAANHSLLGGGGVDGAIHRAAGPELLEECKTLHGCETGEAKITRGYGLSAPYIIHTVGPVYAGKDEDRKLLESCYWNSLELAKENGIHSIAFPAISTGAYGYPLTEAIPIALLTVSKWLEANADYGMAIIMSCFDQKTYDMFQKFLKEVSDGKIKDAK